MHIGKRGHDVDFRAFPKESISKDSKRVDNTLGLLVKVASKHPSATKEVATILLDLVKAQKQSDVGEQARKNKLAAIHKGAKTLKQALKGKSEAHNPELVAKLCEAWVSETHAAYDTDAHHVRKLLEGISRDERRVDFLTVDAKLAAFIGASGMAGVGIETSYTGSRTLRAGVGATVDNSFNLTMAVEANHYSTRTSTNNNPVHVISNVAEGDFRFAIPAWFHSVGEADDDRAALRGVTVGLMLGNVETKRALVSAPIVPLPSSLGPVKELLGIKYSAEQVSLTAMSEAKDAHANEQAQADAAHAKREAARDASQLVKANREAAKARHKANKAKGSIFDRFSALRNSPQMPAAPLEDLKAGPELLTESAPGYKAVVSKSVADAHSTNVLPAYGETDAQSTTDDNAEKIALLAE